MRSTRPLVQESASPVSSEGLRPRRLHAMGRIALLPPPLSPGHTCFIAQHVPPAVRPTVSCARGSGAVSSGRAAPAIGSCGLCRPVPATRRVAPAPLGRDPCACRRPLLPMELFAEQEVSPRCLIYSPVPDPNYSSSGPLGERSQEMLSASVKSDFKLGWPPRRWTPPSTAAPGPSQKSSGDSFSSWKLPVLSISLPPAKLPAPTCPDGSTHKTAQALESPQEEEQASRATSGFGSELEGNRGTQSQGRLGKIGLYGERASPAARTRQRPGWV